MGRYQSSGMRLKRRGESRFDMEWRYAVGWLYPEAKLEEKFSISPREASGRPLPWWRVIGPETRCPLKWRRDLRRASCYALSSATFAAVGAAGLFLFGAPRRDAALLTAVAVTSLQADVTYLGVDHAWRTADTLLAVALIVRYVGLAVARAFSGVFAHAAAVPPLVAALRCFALSQRSTTFRERARHHTRWHLLLQLALLVVLAAEHAHGNAPPADAGF